MNNLAFIDIHSHGAFGVNFNSASYECIKELLEKMYKKNIKAICPTLVGDNFENIQQQLKIFSKIKNDQMQNKLKETFLIGAHLEGTFLSPNKAGIQDKINFLSPSVENFKKLVGEYEDIVKIVTIAPEENIDLVDYLNSKNILTQAGHCLAENIMGCKGVTHIFNAMNQIHHRQSSLPLKALIDDEIYCEVIADLKHLSLDILKLIYKTKPIEKILLVSDSLPNADYDKEIVFCNKKINSNGTDDNGNLAGSNLTIDEICLNLIKNKVFTKDEIFKMAFLNQIDYLKLSNAEIDILHS